MLSAAHLEAQCAYFIQVTLWPSALQDNLHFALVLFVKDSCIEQGWIQNTLCSPHKETDPLTQHYPAFFFSRKRGELRQNVNPTMNEIIN